MAKVMLVEDDNNLREVYEDRLKAEGYEIVSAHDGEEALAVAVKEKPDLIITDIMMPKISGFDMLDILRSTPETKDTKIVMMTALSQTEDKDRADKLGADKYLVKSQVTLEDIVRVAKEMIDGEGAVAAPVGQDNAAPASDQTTPAPAQAQQADVPVAQPPADDQQDDQATDDTTTPDKPAEEPVSEKPTPLTAEEEQPAATPEPAPAPEAPATPTPDAQPETGSTADPEPSQPTTAPAPAASVEDQIKDFISTTEQVKSNANQPTTPATPAPAKTGGTSIPVTDGSAAQTPAAPAQPGQPTPKQQPSEPQAPQLATPSGQKKVIEPINDLNAPGPDLDALMEKENAKPADTTTPVPSVNTVISPDGTLSYASPPEGQDQGKAPTETTQTINPEAATQNQAESQPPQAGDKIDPNIAL